MRIRDGEMAGLLIALGAAQFLLVMTLAEGAAPGYSMHDNAISDLGVIPQTRLAFNLSAITLGLLNAAGGYFLFRSRHDRLLLAVFAIGSVGGIGVGLVPLDSPLGMHSLFAFLAFVCLNLEAILAARTLTDPLRVASIAAGVVGLVFVVVMILTDSGLIDPSGSIGHGGVERMIAYPSLMWMLMFGGYLMVAGARTPGEARPESVLS